jgi:hypothetical protein
MRLFFLAFFLLCCPFIHLKAQTNYPQNYFRNPLNIPIKLAGNFAECRPNHFHTGLDLKTNEQENMSVYAAADGYVSRVSISASGYGNAIYITHPNGYTTLYGHLNDFFPELQAYVVNQQYGKEQWNIDINMSATQFPVKKGQFIAYSGTTGGSTGPHVHFEIRDTKTEHVLNAALFGLKYDDAIPPVAKNIAIYNSQSVYGQDARIIPLKKSGANFITAAPVKVNDSRIRISVRADDYMKGSPNSLGVYEMKLYLDETLQVSWRLNDIDFDENRYVNAFADYKLKEQGKGWYQTLFKTKGNRFSNYTYLNKENGALDIGDGKSHDVRIELEDALGNASNIKFTIISTLAGAPKPLANCNLWTSGKPQSLNTKSISFRCDEAALYDDICFKYTEKESAKGISNEVQIMNTQIPIQTAAILKIKLTHPVPSEFMDKLVFIHHVKAAALPGNNPQDAAAAVFENGWAKAPVKTFGNYYVAIDSVAPVIKPLQTAANVSNSKTIKFSVKDNFTSVAKFSATLDGKWLRFVRAGDIYAYTFDSHCPAGNHSLVIMAADENKNESNLIFTFTR